MINPFLIPPVFYVYVYFIPLPTSTLRTVYTGAAAVIYPDNILLGAPVNVNSVSQIPKQLAPFSPYNLRNDSSESLLSLEFNALGKKFTLNYPALNLV